MASKQGVKSKGFGFNSSKAANSHSSSTTSSSKQFPDTSADGQSSPALSSAQSKPPQQHFYLESVPLDAQRAKENVTVTVRFRPLNPREIRQGEEIAWYADGETIVRSEYNPSIAYAYDHVFGPTTTTRHVYDVAAQDVVSGSMEGVNGTIFAYGVTSSGKTHTMHGNQRSPGIIPLAVKDVFSIIQETPNREFLLRVSYLEIYNEVVNDLLNPAGQNLRVREDAQGTFVEGIKEEVVLSPAHALSLIAAGEEHRHVGSTNFNLLSSRSHTIFTLTIESSPCGENCEGEAVTLSQLNLIDLAGSESSKAETTGMRRREGSYINKSLLTLGTVISKLTEENPSHIPYRDSKLTRLLQSSLSGHGRISLICTVTPSSSSTDETHNTLKFAHRAKHIEIQASQNKIIDEKSLIKKYQQEIQCLKEELEQLKRGIDTVQPKYTGEDDIVLLKQKLEDGQVKLQSRLEQEEEAKAALLGRIQRLTKLILVSTKASHSTRFPNRPGPRRRHSFGEEELAYLPYKRRDLILDEENIDLYVNVEGNSVTADDSFKEEKKAKKHGLLKWLKSRKRDSASSGISDQCSGAKSTSTPSTPQQEICNHAERSPSADPISEAREDKDIDEDSFLGQERHLTNIKSVDQIDLLREHHKILCEEVALHSSSLKRLSEETARNPQNGQIHVEIRRLKDEIKVEKDQIELLEKRISSSSIASDDMDQSGVSQIVAEMMAQLHEKSFELEVKSADNRIIQQKLNQKICECESLQEIISSLEQQLADALDLRSVSPVVNHSQHFSLTKDYSGELNPEKGNVNFTNEGTLLQAQVSELEELKQKVAELTESKEHLELRNQKLAEESSYAKGLASAAAVELKALSEEVAKLMNHNERLAAELAASKNSPIQRRTSGIVQKGRRENHAKLRRNDQTGSNPNIKRELALSKEREISHEAALSEKDQKEAELQRKIEESKQREAYLENELANMRVFVAKLKKTQGTETDVCSFTRESLQLDGLEI
ncbi:PREDICTED: kinesin-like protein KIN-7K, chloroplastic isoform X2 [Lupinus angustifolius]|uniref:kinesin-like protein KIN-7K, chloroplastic isoform X2 n=1 Tax=Lupinus angustifolius TaxID=3871 RepID=UPI00092FB23B|nr:PREDICTED: kinesin-like protein KIN-7K, chloroplastic isoform X2 [Lupinus angustifolius]